MLRSTPIVLTMVALASCADRAPAPAPARLPASEEPAPSGAGRKAPQPPLPPGAYHAVFREPCGRSLLEISDGSGRTELVQAVGDQSPIRRLRLHALLGGRFVVEGRRTGKVRDDHHCGAYPELEVTSFRPWGPVRRMFSAGSLNEELHFYTEQLPVDRFAPEDFEGGPTPPSLDSDRCTDRGACPARWVRQTDSDGTRLCCPFL